MDQGTANRILNALIATLVAETRRAATAAVTDELTTRWNKPEWARY